ncbi:hypothetical protein SADUNF_Sadunf01G0123100 [Salix dunnii]|uniref:Uncharacterized protein n=1 Tax=Salix dunnii TaxID=1413687 RepID=A0A835NBX5_9ROSI|nr:hypothetical protein SADUNF_Sadunf01G0123100 [Salix dunnii]
MSRIVNELDPIHFSIKKASKMVKEIGRQVVTDKCIMALLFVIVIGVIAITIVKLSPMDPQMLRSLLGNGPYKLGAVEVGLNKKNLTLNLSSPLQLKLVNPNNKDILDIPGLAPPVLQINLEFKL